MYLILALILGVLLLAIMAARALCRFSLFLPRCRPVGFMPLALAAVGLLLFSPRLTLAAETAPAQVLDLAPLWNWALSFAIAALAFYGRRALIAIESRLNIQSGSAAADDLDQALVHGEAFLLNGLKALAASTSTVTISAGPLANAVALVQKLAPAAEAALGVTPADIENILLARIGVKVAPAAAVPEPAPAKAVAPVTPAPTAAPTA
jgi:hypothetical protein